MNGQNTLTEYKQLLPLAISKCSGLERLALFLKDSKYDPQSPLKRFWFTSEIAPALLFCPRTAIVLPSDSSLGGILRGLHEMDLNVPEDVHFAPTTMKSVSPQCRLILLIMVQRSWAIEV